VCIEEIPEEAVLDINDIRSVATAELYQTTWWSPAVSYSDSNNEHEFSWWTWNVSNSVNKIFPRYLERMLFDFNNHQVFGDTCSFKCTAHRNYL